MTGITRLRSVFSYQDQDLNYLRKYPKDCSPHYEQPFVRLLDWFADKMTMNALLLLIDVLTQETISASSHL